MHAYFFLGGAAEQHGGLRVGMSVLTINSAKVSGLDSATTKNLQCVIKSIGKIMVLTFAPS